MINIDKASQIKGWMSIAELTWLAGQAETSHSIIEVGCYHGRSTRVLRDNCPGIIFAIDTWAEDYIKDNGQPLIKIGDPVMNSFLRNMQQESNNPTAMLVILRKTLTEAIEDIVAKVDMIFLDGDHRYQMVVEDIQAALRLIHSGGLICGHDYDHPDWPGVKQAVTEWFPHAKRGPGSIWYVRV